MYVNKAMVSHFKNLTTSLRTWFAKGDMVIKRGDLRSHVTTISEDAIESILNADHVQARMMFHTLKNNLF